ncbi:trypsin-like peptidase domain-containing protein [Actinoplanes derwentensis]|uniref:V8-like Glu-specific endopeptidase n=1 Tax=Actinoplanes derwentensis TaxID=113562 RepID=A0A1H2AWS6_9ACTN|nr:trypsin-like peptidase domain-containing protein [Actinoplanes derwentensis]GID87274.1 hypothetical protein Ade03nite_61980 [Actinoplanes derwentensis]SDT50381.1 V8-like Glu-specific endopeptidase [Actinoplanes derwentensis]
MPLAGRQLKAVDEALLDAFGLKALDRLLLHGLDMHREHLSIGDDLTEVVFAVTRELNRRDRIPELVAVAGAYRPAHRGLSELADRLLAAPVRPAARPALELLLSGDRRRLLDARDWHLRLGALQRRVARVELTDGARLGTAFLAGPDVAVTCHHVLERFVSGAAPATMVRLRFDVRTSATDSPISPGVTYPLATDWLVDASPPSAGERRGAVDTPEPTGDELDFVAIRLDGRPGEEPVDGIRELPDAPDRGWLPLPAAGSPPEAGDPLFVLQHPHGGPLKLAFDRVLGVNGGGTRIRHTVDTEPGSSGSPCFDRDLNLVAVHHSGDPAAFGGAAPGFNQAVPIGPIALRLARAGVCVD